MEERSNVSKAFYKIVLYSVKVVPMLIAGIYLLNTVLSYFDIDCDWLSYFVQLLFILGLYMLSIAFRFCRWHRMFIHYILVITIINIIDYKFGIMLSDRNLFLMYGIITGLFLFLALYFRFKVCKNQCQTS